MSSGLVAVIGAGLGGLSCAARLANAGFRGPLPARYVLIQRLFFAGLRIASGNE